MSSRGEGSRAVRMGLAPVSQLLLIEQGEPAKKQEEVGPRRKMFQERHRPVNRLQLPPHPSLSLVRAGLV